MDKLTFFGLIATYLTVAIFYLSEPKRFALVFDVSYFPKNQKALLKVIVWALLIGVCIFWTGEPYGWEVGITRWLVALTLIGFVVIFLAPKKPKIFKATLLLAFILGGVVLVL